MIVEMCKGNGSDGKLNGGDNRRGRDYNCLLRVGNAVNHFR